MESRLLSSATVKTLRDPEQVATMLAKINASSVCTKMTLEELNSLISPYLNDPLDRIAIYVSLQWIRAKLHSATDLCHYRRATSAKLTINLAEFNSYLRTHFGLAGWFDFTRFASLGIAYNATIQVEQLAAVATLESMLQNNEGSEALALINASAQAVADPSKAHQPLFIFEDNQLFCTLHGPKTPWLAHAKMLCLMGQRYQVDLPEDPDALLKHFSEESSQSKLTTQFCKELDRGETANLLSYKSPEFDEFMADILAKSQSILASLAATKEAFSEPRSSASGLY